MYNMKKLILSVFIFTFGFATATNAQPVNTLLTKQLPEAPGKEIEVITVNYAPGAVDEIHRHDAHAVVYVGQEFPVEVSFRELTMNGRRVFTGFIRDISEQKQAEEQREKLRRAQVDLAHINRVSTMGELTASLGHEIKQPISAA